MASISGFFATQARPAFPRIAFALKFDQDGLSFWQCGMNPRMYCEIGWSSISLVSVIEHDVRSVTYFALQVQLRDPGHPLEFRVSDERGIGLRLRNRAELDQLAQEVDALREARAIDDAT
ncbi:MAG: hypothetical protein V4479_13565 [Actinomycetota bacterium]